MEAAVTYGLPVALLAVASTMWPLKHAIDLIGGAKGSAKGGRPVPVSS